MRARSSLIANSRTPALRDSVDNLGMANARYRRENRARHRPSRGGQIQRTEGTAPVAAFSRTTAQRALSGPAAALFTGSLGVDGEGVDAGAQLLRQCRVDRAMPLDAALAFKRLRDHFNFKVGFSRGASPPRSSGDVGMAGVFVRFVNDFERYWRERRFQFRLHRIGDRRSCRTSHGFCMIAHPHLLRRAKIPRLLVKIELDYLFTALTRLRPLQRHS